MLDSCKQRRGVAQRLANELIGSDRLAAADDVDDLQRIASLADRLRHVRDEIASTRHEGDAPAHQSSLWPFRGRVSGMATRLASVKRMLPSNSTEATSGAFFA